MTKLRLNIDGREVTGFTGQTILQVAKQNGIGIPNLCYDEKLKIYGSCGLCVVEVEGVPKLLRACATEISDNMVVRTRSERIDQSRKTALELILSNHTGDCKAPCHLACPAETDCQGYVGLIANGQYEEAVALIKEKLPLPASIGRVCPHPCEDACRRNLVDKPVAIAALKRFVGDVVLERKSGLKTDKKPDTGKKVAIIGGGPAGLSCAFFLAKEGHRPVIYEAMPKPGGMLRYGIPQYRLPKDIVDLEIEGIKEMGVEINTGIRVGKDISLDYLRQQYDAVFIGVGAWKSSEMRCPGEDLEGVLGGIDFLVDIAQNKPVAIGDRVAVVGGGNTAMDAARTAVRLGAKQVMVVYRRTEQEMPAERIEIEEAREEGVEFRFLLAPIEVIGQDGRVKTLRCQQMEMGQPDASGRRRPVPIEGSEVTIDVDTVIAAIGQRLDAAGLDGVGLTKRGTVQYDEQTFQTNLPGVFAGGDAAAGPGIAIEAIAQGQKAAEVISSYLSGTIVPVAKRIYVKQENLTREDLKDKEVKERIEAEVMMPDARKHNFLEIARRYTEIEAEKEASRCLECGCGDVFECKLLEYMNIYNAQPERFDGEKTQTDSEDNHPFIDRNPYKCILCGLCVRTCDEITGITALGLVDRGFDTVVKPEFGMRLQDTDCISCGQCVSVCPVGALQEKPAIAKRVPVEEKTTLSVCSYCSIGCNTRLASKGSMLLRSLPDRESPADNGLLCVKGRFGFDYAQSKGRIERPMVRINGQLNETEFEQAFTYIAKQLNSIRSRYGNDSVAVLASARLTNEECYAITTLAADVIKTPNLASSSNNCNTGIAEVLGINASTNSLDELGSTDLVLYIGGESYTSHPVLGMKLLSAVKQGTKLITISPDRIRAGEWAEIEVCGQDNLGLIKGMLKQTILSGSINPIAVQAKAEGYAELKSALDRVMPSELAIKLAKLYNSVKSAIIVIDELTVSPEATKLLADLAVITGKIGRPRNGIILLKPLSNSQGCYDMGIKKSLGDIDWGKIKAVISFGEDPAMLKSINLELLVVSDMFMSDTANAADVILPAASYAEDSGTYTNTERRVQKLKALLAPKAGMTNLQIISGLSRTMGTSISSCPEAQWKQVKAFVEGYSGIDDIDLDSRQAFWSPDRNRVLYTAGFAFDNRKARLYATDKESNLFRPVAIEDTVERYFNNRITAAGLR
jgi:formate dehydrogenase major subunit